MTKVMVVDDSDFVRERVVSLLEREGFEVSTARNGRQAVDTYRLERPEVVLMDITMPELDGLGALTKIREMDGSACVIMLTAVDQQMMVTRAIHLGARDYLTKPVAARTLVSAIERTKASRPIYAH